MLQNKLIFRAGYNFPDGFVFFHHKTQFLEIKAFSGKAAISKYVFLQKNSVPSRVRNYSVITASKFCMQKELQMLITSTENTSNSYSP